MSLDIHGYARGLRQSRTWEDGRRSATSPHPEPDAADHGDKKQGHRDENQLGRTNSEHAKERSCEPLSTATLTATRTLFSGSCPRRVDPQVAPSSGPPP